MSVQLFKGKYYDYNHYSDFTNASALGGLSTEASLVFSICVQLGLELDQKKKKNVTFLAMIIFLLQSE